jgi:hypothetical protein
MRHARVDRILSSASFAPSPRARCVHRPPPLAALVAPSSFELSFTPRRGGAGLAAVDLATIALSAQPHLHAAASAEKEPSNLIVHVVELQALRARWGTS